MNKHNENKLTKNSHHHEQRNLVAIIFTLRLEQSMLQNDYPSKNNKGSYDNCTSIQNTRVSLGHYFQDLQSE